MIQKIVKSFEIKVELWQKLKGSWRIIIYCLFGTTIANGFEISDWLNTKAIILKIVGLGSNNKRSLFSKTI